jgi:hypothetical protein
MCEVNTLLGPLSAVNLKLLSTVMWRCVIWDICISVSDEHAAFIFKAVSSTESFVLNYQTINYCLYVCDDHNS